MNSTRRYRICYEKIDDPDFPVLPLTGTLSEIRNDLHAYLARHPELDENNFREYKRDEL